MLSDDAIADIVERGAQGGTPALKPLERPVFLVAKAEIACDTASMGSLRLDRPEQHALDYAVAFAAIGADSIAGVFRRLAAARSLDDGPGPLTELQTLIANRQGYTPEAIRWYVQLAVGPFTDTPWLEPWGPLRDPAAAEVELRRELAPSHQLYKMSPLRALARRQDLDDFLFVSARLPLVIAVVHLTWQRERDPRWPTTQLFTSGRSWAEDCMRADHLYFTGDEDADPGPA